MPIKRTGKGIAAVFEGIGSQSSGATFKEIDLLEIIPNANQPRKEFNQEQLQELIDSIKEVGILQPVLVRELEHQVEAGKYELIAGERRFRAAQKVGLKTIPAVIRSAVDQESLEQALAENLHRSELNPLEEAAAYQSLIDDFGLTQQEVAIRVNKNRATIANTIRLVELSVPIQKMLNDGMLSAGHARTLLGVTPEKKQIETAKKVIKQNWSVRKLEDFVQSNKQKSSDSKTKTRTSKTKSAVILELENLLAEHLATRVKIQIQNKEKGKIQVEFFGLDDLERIYQKMQGKIN